MFTEFFDSLPESDFVRPKEELEQVLLHAIDCCNAQIVEGADGVEDCLMV